MKRFRIVALVLACSLVGVGCASEHYVQHARELAAGADTLALMTNRDVIALSKAGLGDDVIISMIDVAGSDFHLRTQDVIALADSGVTDKVIGAMIKRGESSQYVDRSGGYYYYPPYYWYSSPYWYPWYPSTYLGLSVGYYRPLYFHRAYAPFYGYSNRHGFYGGHGSGGFRSGGHRR